MLESPNAVAQWIKNGQINRVSSNTEDPAMESEQLSVLISDYSDRHGVADRVVMLHGPMDVWCALHGMSERGLPEAGHSWMLMVRPYIHMTPIMIGRADDGTIEAVVIETQGWGKEYAPTVRMVEAIKDVWPDSRVLRLTERSRLTLLATTSAPRLVRASVSVEAKKSAPAKTSSGRAATSLRTRL